jgi:hypothetical protein
MLMENQDRNDLENFSVLEPDQKELDVRITPEKAGASGRVAHAKRLEKAT